MTLFAVAKSTYSIWTSYVESSLSISEYYEYANLSSSGIDHGNLGFREVIYDVVGLHFETPNQSTYYHAPPINNLI